MADSSNGRLPSLGEPLLDRDDLASVELDEPTEVTGNDLNLVESTLPARSTQVEQIGQMLVTPVSCQFVAPPYCGPAASSAKRWLSRPAQIADRLRERYALGLDTELLDQCLGGT